MDIADKIIEALREKYRPLGIAVYGSFADGSNNRNSDFDALLLLPDGETGHDDSVLFGTELDVWLYGAAHFAAPYDAEDFLQLHDSVIVEDATGRLSALRAEVNAHIESAPQKTEAENAQSLSWCRKMLRAASITSGQKRRCAGWQIPRRTTPRSMSAPCTNHRRKISPRGSAYWKRRFPGDTGREE